MQRPEESYVRSIMLAAFFTLGTLIVLLVLLIPRMYKDTMEETEIVTPEVVLVHKAEYSFPVLTEDEIFLKECIDIHNSLRKRHGVYPLSLSDKLNKYSAAWAKQLALENKMYHRPHDMYGENLYRKWSSAAFKVSCKDAVTNWYNEIKFYDFSKEVQENNNPTGHFTQIVWKSSRDVGCGFASNKLGSVFIVCNYYPPGNVKTNYMKNVIKPL